VALVGSAIGREWAALSALPSAADVVSAVDGIVSSGATGWVLSPFRALSRVPVTSTTVGYWSALPGALAVLAINYLWVLRADTAFEESAAILAEKRVDARPAARVAPRAPGATSTPFALAPTGRPEWAILWKNLIMVGRYASLRTLLRLAPAVVMVGFSISIVGRRSGLASAGAMVCLGLLAFTILIGPIVSRNDLRRDLGNLAMLKAWPLSGASLLRGEILAPTVLLTSLAWLAIVGAAALVGYLPLREAAAVVLNRVSYLAAAMLVAPALILAQVTALNGMAVLLPAWITTGATRSRGVDAMGQRLLTTAGLLVVLVVAVVPAALLGGVSAGAVWFMMGAVPIVLPAAILSAVLVAECAATIEGLGGVLDRTAVSSVSPE